MNRRNFLEKTALGLAVTPALAGAATLRPAAAPQGYVFSIFSKNLQWLDYTGMAGTAAELGFAGVDLTVRPGGHVEPERVTEDLPRAVEAIRKAGLEVFSIVTAIGKAEDPHTESILKTAGGLGIGVYRTGWYQYDEKVSISDNLRTIAGILRDLDALNEQYGMSAGYQNHAGKYFGAPVWDLAQCLKSIDARRTGSQYDIYHATIEGANSWIYGLRLIAPWITSINIKDYEWKKKDGRWVTESVPLGKGAVDFERYFRLLGELKVACPVSVHYEYPLGSADQGGRRLTMDKKEVLRFMKTDLEFLKTRMKEAGLI